MATPETLQRQVAIARASGRAPLAENLERAAELARVPDDELLAIYTALRPHRSTAAELEEWAVKLEGWGATRTVAANLLSGTEMEQQQHEQVGFHGNQEDEAAFPAGGRPHRPLV